MILFVCDGAICDAAPCYTQPRNTPNKRKRTFDMQNGDTALHFASVCGRTSCVKLLLAHGADPHAVNKVRVRET